MQNTKFKFVLNRSKSVIRYDLKRYTQIALLTKIEKNLKTQNSTFIVFAQAFFEAVSIFRCLFWGNVEENLLQIA